MAADTRADTNKHNAQRIGTIFRPIRACDFTGLPDILPALLTTDYPEPPLLPDRRSKLRKHLLGGEFQLVVDDFGVGVLAWQKVEDCLYLPLWSKDAGGATAYMKLRSWPGKRSDTKAWGLEFTLVNSGVWKDDDWEELVGMEV